MQATKMYACATKLTFLNYLWVTGEKKSGSSPMQTERGKAVQKRCARCTFQFLIDWRWSCAWESETMILSEKLNRNTKSRFHFGCRHIVRVNEIKNYRQNNGSINSNIVQTSSIDECKIVFEAVWIRANRSPTKLILKQDNKITKWRRRKRWIAVWIPF